MSGRGRGRPPSRSAQEPAMGGNRRSTRQQQQQQQPQQNLDQSTAAGEEQLQLDSAEQQLLAELQPQGQEQQLHDPQPEQPEAPMDANDYHQIIDPAITGPQDGDVPPPPVPSAKGLRRQAESRFPHRKSDRNGWQLGSQETIGSINSIAGETDAFLSQSQPQSTTLQRATPNRVFGTPGRASSIAAFPAVVDTPSRAAAKVELMSDMVMRLFDAADDLVTHLLRATADAEIWEAKREVFKKAFDFYRSYYEEDANDLVVDPHFVAQKMQVDPTSPLRSKVFRVVSAANLATLLNEISPVSQEVLLPLLQILDSDFPAFFVGAGSDNDDDAMNEQIMQQVVMIRTHLSILMLERLKTDSPAPFHPAEQIASFWWDGDVSVAAIEELRSGNEDALQLKPIPRADSEAVAGLARDRNSSRFNSICAMLPNHPVEGRNLHLEELHDTYPVEEFIRNLRSFVEDCFGRIRKLLEQEKYPLLSGSGDSQIRSQPASSLMAYEQIDPAVSGAPQVAYNLDGLRAMKRAEQQGPAVYGDDHQLPAGTYPAPPRIPYPPGFSGSSQAGLDYAEPSQQGGFQSSGSLYAESAAQISGRKRGAQDDAAAAGIGTAASGQPPAKKPRGRRKKNDAPVAAMAASTAASASAPAAAPIIHPEYPPLPGTRDEPDFEALSQRTRELSAASRKVKEPQVRSPWVQKDVRLLLKAVDTYQCKWSTIEKEIKAGTIPFDRPRDQQALRDKARLLKQDFLKADALLPRSFDLVVLGKKEREAVKAVGKNPDRKEADVDAEGRPTNTHYNPDAVVAQAAVAAPPPPPQVQPEQQFQAPPQSEAQPVGSGQEAA